MKHLWTIYNWTCANPACREWQYEARVPRDRSVREYAPDYCRKCGGKPMIENVRGEAA
jgi:hypothetical protein